MLRKLSLNHLARSWTLTKALFSGVHTIQGTPQQRLSRLEKYAAIKEKNALRKKQQRQQKQLAKHAMHKQLESNLKHAGDKQLGLNCEGCSAKLQTAESHKYGFIERDALYSNLNHNKQVLQNMSNRSDYTNKAIREVQKDLGVKIIQDKVTGKLNLDNVQVLMALQERIGELNKQRQSVITPDLERKELLCRRCFYLKHHNRLPDEFNRVDDESLSLTDEEFTLNKIFGKKGEDLYFFYVVDLFDLLGTLTRTVITRLLLSGKKFSILLTKYDVINGTYLNYPAFRPLVKQRISQVVSELKSSGSLDPDYDLSKYLDKVIYVSNENRIGITKVKQLLESLEGRVQMIGYPNTGKTSLLNLITSSKKPTSTIPGTTLSFQMGKFNKVKLFDCPGLTNKQSMTNIIVSPNQKALLTWKQPNFAPGLLTNSVIFYGGMIVCEGARIIVFGHGGAKAISPDPQISMNWLLLNYQEVWKGLPQLSELRIKKYELELEFSQRGTGKDIEIAGYGFIGLRLCKGVMKGAGLRKVTLYLPEGVAFIVRNSLIIDNEVHVRSSIRKEFQLSRIKPKALMKNKNI